MDQEIQLTFHHIGCLTPDMDRSVSVYAEKMGFEKVSEPVLVSTQQVTVCFIRLRGGPLIELIQPMGNNSALAKILKSGNPYYHIGYFTGNIKKAIDRFQKDGFYLVNEFISEAFEGRNCAFLYTSEMHLIELIEDPYAV